MLPPNFFRRTPRQTHHRRPRSPRHIHLTFQDGRFQVAGLNAWHSYWQDPYHLLLTIPWAGFVLLMVFLYIVINLLFAVAYLVGGDCLEHAQPGSFSDAFFFSVQTLSTIGYGSVYPKTLYANLLVTGEAFVGIFSVALMTGLAFARFAQPTARVMFSQVAVIYISEGIPTLMLRTANQRRNQILEAQIRLYFMRDEITKEGDFFRRIYELPLLRSRTPSFSLSWTVMHTIDATSPLYQATPDSFTQAKVSLIASLTGIDETVGQPIHARHVYAAQDIHWHHRFVDIIHQSADGQRYIDYADFHDVTPVELASEQDDPH